MPRRITANDPPAGRTREELVAAWIMANARLLPDGRSREPQEVTWITRRLKTHVSMGDVLAANIPRSVCLGNGSKVSWDSEPTAPDGRGIEWFQVALDSLGPLAIQVVDEALRVWGSAAYRDALVRAGVEVRAGKFGVADWMAKSGRGHRVLKALSEAIRDHVRSSPGALATVSSDPAALVAAVSPGVVADLVRSAAAATRLLASLRTIPGGFHPAAILKDARGVCDTSCPRNRVRSNPTEDDLITGLNALIERWVKKSDTSAEAPRAPRDWSAPFTAGMLVRFAHTLIDESYQLPRWQVVRDHYDANAFPRLTAAARHSPLGQADRDDLVQSSALNALERLSHNVLDAYVDFLRVPGLQDLPELTDVAPDDYPATAMSIQERDYWIGRVDAAIDLRGTEDLIRERNRILPDGDLQDTERAFGTALVAPWDAGYLPSSYQPGDQGAVERDYWRNRDTVLTQGEEYLRLLARQRKAGRKEPGRTIEEIALLAALLVPAATQELGIGAGSQPADGPDAPGSSVADAATRWITDRAGLEAVLRHGYRQTATTLEAWHARVDLHSLYPGTDIESAMDGACPQDWDLRDWADVTAVVQRAVVRAAVVVYGRRAVDDAYDHDIDPGDTVPDDAMPVDDDDA